MDIGLIARRTVLVAATSALAVVAGLQAGGAAMSRTEPQKALRLNANDAVALVSETDRRILATQGAKLDPVATAATARRALLLSPLNSGALRQLGISADTANDHLRARSMMQLSNRVSRRDFLTHLWMIEDSAGSGDIPAALDHYDLALSTNDRGIGALFPVLSAALGDADIRAAFLPMIGKGRPWMADFLGYAILTNPNPENIATLIMARGGLPKGRAYAPLAAQLLAQLLNKGQYAVAYRYGLSLPGMQPKLLGDASFSVVAPNPALAPLMWQFTDQPEVRTRREDAGRLAVVAASNARNVAASRILYLRPGTYHFTQSVEPLSGLEAAPLLWELRCLPATGPDPIWRQELPIVTAAGRYRATLTVPAGCQAEQLTLTITGRDLQSDSGVKLGPVALEGPVSQ